MIKDRDCVERFVIGESIKMKISILSDTHGLLRDEILEQLKGSDVIFHGGDINTQDIVNQIREIAPTYVVRGNNDKEWAENLPNEISVSIGGFSFFMTHKKSDLPGDLSKYDFVIFGHSHKYEVVESATSVLINPGSCGPRMFHKPVTMCILEIDDENHTYEIKKIDVSPTVTKSQINTLSTKDLYAVIKNIIKDMNSGKKIEDIAVRNRVDEEFVNDVVRMYVNHPGIDVDGILDRIEIKGK